MVLFSFSIPNHIEQIKNGMKHQTTRIPRKAHKNGNPAYKVGDKVQLYYHSRQKASCQNCLINCEIRERDIDICVDHTNHLGQSEIIEILHYDVLLNTPTISGIWMYDHIGDLAQNAKELWAIQDGFKSWEEANTWFKTSTGFDLWAYRPLDVIIWDPEPIIKRWQKNEQNKD